MPRALAQLAARLRREPVSPDADATDRDLLTRFLRDQDEAAFEVLVVRHARLVGSAIAKVLADPHDAEDAFQATFLILVRRARSIDWGTGFGPWLYGVAHRVAVKVRDASRTRARREKGGGSRPAPPSPIDLSWREACALLHAELDRLPDRYRLPLLLCHLEGKTRDEAAAALQVTVGTVKGRLERGRELLRTRLARRGVALSVALVAAVAAPGAHAVPPPVSVTLRAARGGASDRVLTLTREFAMSSVLSQFAQSVAGVLGVVAVASVLLAAGAGVPTHATDEKRTPPAPQPGAVKTAEEPKGTTKTDAFVVNVQVKKPDGKPAAGANVWVWADDQKLTEGRTDANGRADLTVPKFFERVTVFASAPEYGPDWSESRPVAPGKPAAGSPTELTLVENERAIEARFTDLEGRPLANLPVEVLRLAKLYPGQTWAEFRAKRAADDLALQSLPRVRGTAAGLPKQLSTDKDGRIKLTGVGKDRLVSLATAGQTHEYTLVRIVCRELEKSEELPGHEPLCGARGTVPLAPARTLTGTVRDARTGAPVPGMKVTDIGFHLTGAVTDKDGKFTLHGMKKQREYALAFGSLGVAPYFDLNESLPDTPGFEPLPIDVKVYRGVVATGRVTDDRGRPLRGHMFYHWTDDNPNVAEYGRGTRAGYRVSNWGDLDADGRYKLLVIPGPGLVGVCARPERLFPRLDAQKESAPRKVYSWPGAPLHALREVNFDPGNEKTFVHNFSLTPGAVCDLTIRGEGGKLTERLLAVGQSEAAEAQPVVGATLKLTGLSPTRARAVVFMDDAKTVGAVAAVTGGAGTPVTVTLEKLGAVSGRLRTADGSPAIGAEVRVRLLLDRAKYDNLPDEVFTTLGVSGIEPGAWKHFTGRTARTDKDGTFTLTGLLPGQEYHLIAGFNVEKMGGELLHERNGVTVKPGGTTDLGDLNPKK
ncbi:sigma-70 family RNA polymerase sigma factor [Frigoriglobus tundricola]|uniref:Uncharacterized protein n=1 Tax=Frigoriglobus tundricola TaxID=2774151 RepID=A0A6M5YNI5_9BACT|nr:sigma-70 family RNA polymerase sigma factor [Frigoriglobus tundricola]QJW94811.1 hypothetical protein FTUN_2335 [Frigoriglobus tundricola]